MSESVKSLEHRIHKAAPDCFIDYNPKFDQNTFFNIQPVSGRKDIYVLQMVSNGYQTNDHVNYNQINDEIYIKLGKKKTQLAEKLSELIRFNPKATRESINHNLSVPGHTTYSMHKKGDWLVTAVNNDDVVSGIVRCLRINNYLLK